MPILFSISVLALVALLWASIAAAQHIRRARRRKRRTLGPEQLSAQARPRLQGTEASSGTDEMSFRETQPFLRPEASTPQTIRLDETRTKVALREPELPYIPAPAYVPKMTFSQVAPVISVAERTVPVAAEFEPRSSYQVAQSDARDTPTRLPRLGLFSAAQELSEERLANATPTTEPEVAAIHETVHRAPVPVPVAPMPMRATRPTSARTAAKMERPDWAYFNKDMGDLTDPYESSRNRSRITLGESRH